jgi:hypothetical protein
MDRSTQPFIVVLQRKMKSKVARKCVIPVCSNSIAYSCSREKDLDLKTSCSIFVCAFVGPIEHAQACMSASRLCEIDLMLTGR